MLGASRVPGGEELRAVEDGGEGGCVGRLGGSVRRHLDLTRYGVAHVAARATSQGGQGVWDLPSHSPVSETERQGEHSDRINRLDKSDGISKR